MSSQRTALDKARIYLQKTKNLIGNTAVNFSMHLHKCNCFNVFVLLHLISRLSTSFIISHAHTRKFAHN